jgi:peptidoglycan/xylan/chitin deacetylase (PgdA/CDA1 family)
MKKMENRQNEKNILKHLLITFDYELFLGKKSGSVEKCVIEPTNRIIRILSKYNAKGIFFVDTAWLVNLKRIAANYSLANESYKKVVAQIQKLITEGHYVFNHLHPHWLDAQYIPDTNEWDLSNHSLYRLSSLNHAQRDAIFAQTTEVLKEIITPVKPGYLAEGYRAGGWSIQPFDDFKPYFQKYGIKFDFSVKPGMKSITTAQQYDFTGVNITTPYSFSDSPTVISNGDYTEFPITGLYVPKYIKPLNRILLKYLWLRGDRYSFSGHGISPTVLEETTTKTEMVSIELLTITKLPIYLKLLKKHNYVQFISHPKMITKHNIDTFTFFMKKAFERYPIETDFKNMLP